MTKKTHKNQMIQLHFGQSNRPFSVLSDFSLKPQTNESVLTLKSLKVKEESFNSSLQL